GQVDGPGRKRPGAADPQRRLARHNCAAAPVGADQATLPQAPAGLSPTAQMSLAEVAEMDCREVDSGSGLGTAAQALPVQCSITASRGGEPERGEPEPTAHTSHDETTAMPSSVVEPA